MSTYLAPELSVALKSPLEGWYGVASKDGASVTPDWFPTNKPGIDGVSIKEIRAVATSDGCLTEIWRKDWNLDDLPVAQIFQRFMDPGAVSEWHAHERTTDRLFCGYGRIALSLYDGRQDSPSFEHSWRGIMCAETPRLVIVPPGVWHAVAVLGSSSAQVINAVDQAYSYTEPDHWRLPDGSEHIAIKP